MVSNWVVCERDNNLYFQTRNVWEMSVVITLAGFHSVSVSQNSNQPNQTMKLIRLFVAICTATLLVSCNPYYGGGYGSPYGQNCGRPPMMGGLPQAVVFTRRVTQYRCQNGCSQPRASMPCPPPQMQPFFYPPGFGGAYQQTYPPQNYGGYGQYRPSCPPPPCGHGNQSMYRY